MCRLQPAWSRTQYPRWNGRKPKTRLAPCCVRPSKCKTDWMGSSDMLLMIDNYDSFTYNLVQYFGELGEDVIVFRNDEITPDEVMRLKPARIVISPGPCTPSKAGISMPVIASYDREVPILGVCLGHQSIGQVFGGKIIHAKQVMHGKTSPIFHTDVGVFRGLPNPFTA